MRSMALLAALLVAPHLLFLAVDQRPPNDHDVWYTLGVAESWTNAALAPSSSGRWQVVLDHFLFEGWHPQLAQTVMLALMVALGPSLLVFRGVNLLFWGLLVGSSYAIGRQLRSHRFGLLLMVLVAWLPSMLLYTRKWDPMFHGAALSALSWALALRCLRPDALRLRWPWVALGLAVGLRLYTHPTGIPDLGLTLSLTVGFVVVRTWRRAEELGPALARGALAVGVALAVGAWYLGLIPVVPQEPSYQLLQYFEWRMPYIAVDEGKLSPLRQIAGTADLVAALFRWHWHPVPALALGVPGLLALWGAARRATPFSGLLLLLAIALLQLPLVQHTFANGAVTSDWLHLIPLFVILTAFALVELSMGVDRRATLARAGLTLTVGYCGFAAFVPLAASFEGPDPLMDDRAYSSWTWSSFTSVDTGGREETPHLLSSRIQAADEVARRMAASAAEGDLEHAGFVEVLDLSVVRAQDCQLETRPRGGAHERFEPAWAFRFAGWRGVETEEGPGTDARFVLVRLWHGDRVVGPTNEAQLGEELRATAVGRCLEATDRWVERTFPDVTHHPLIDPDGRLISRGWEERTEYAHRGYLIDRGEGRLTSRIGYKNPRGGRLPN